MDIAERVGADDPARQPDETARRGGAHLVDDDLVGECIVFGLDRLVARPIDPGRIDRDIDVPLYRALLVQGAVITEHDIGSAPVRTSKN